MLKDLLGVHPGFPKEGITFLDIFPVLRNPVAFECLITHLLSHIFTHTIPTLIPSSSSTIARPSFTPAIAPSESIATSTGPGKSSKIDVVVGLDARGFLLGPVLALRLGAAFVPIRKKGKLPGNVKVVAYEKEYGVDEFEIHADAITPGQNCVVVDDLIATGGSASAAGKLVSLCGGKVVEYLFVVGLPFLKGEEKLDAPAYSMIEAED